MEKFSKTRHGYNPEEVNKFLDQVINQVEGLVDLIKEKDKIIKELESKIDNKEEKLSKYAKMENTLSNAIMMAQKTSDQIKANAYRESEIVLEQARNNANRIVSDALRDAEKTEFDAHKLRKNIVVYKRKLRDFLQSQLDMIDEIENVDF